MSSPAAVLASVIRDATAITLGERDTVDVKLSLPPDREQRD
jgi:hypothetical protein